MMSMQRKVGHPATPLVHAGKCGIGHRERGVWTGWFQTVKRGGGGAAISMLMREERAAAWRSLCRRWNEHYELVLTLAVGLLVSDSRLRTLVA